MKTFGIRLFFAAVGVVGFGLSANNAHAAGPVSTQQTVAQVQSTVSEASIGFRRWGHYRGFGLGLGLGLGYGYGGGFGGYRYGGYGYGYPGYGYAGYGYARPVIYGYPTYAVRYRPRYVYSNSYASPYQSACCCGYSSYQPAVYNNSSYSYPAQPVIYSTPTVYNSSTYSAPVVYATPAYSTPVNPSTVYGTSTYGSGSGLYVPTYTSPTVISSPATIYPSSNRYSAPPVPAPYPAPPAEYSQPSASQSPVAVSPTLMVTQSATVIKSQSLAYRGLSHAAYAPASYQYSPVTSSTGLASYRSAW